MFLRFLLGILIVMLGAGGAWAHTPLCGCFDNGDGTVTCEGGFSDGSSASGVKMRVETPDGKVLIEGVMDEDSEYSFDKPNQDYVVVFDGGDAHVLRLSGGDITE